MDDLIGDVKNIIESEGWDKFRNLENRQETE